jgi:ubiquinone/menaquinone biosynthesis C-methylase UbiE
LEIPNIERTEHHAETKSRGNRFRDRGWIETKDIIKSGITRGQVLEIGPGPGYLGLEWLKHTEGTTLKGLDISTDMLSIAERHAKEYGLHGRVEYIHSSGDHMPFEDESFNAVFTNGSLHEWSNPRDTLEEVWRVLQKEGKFFISDLRRDMSFLARWFLWAVTKPKEIRPGLLTSINASYTPNEVREMVKATRFSSYHVSGNFIGLKLTGIK